MTIEQAIPVVLTNVIINATLLFLIVITSGIAISEWFRRDMKKEGKVFTFWKIFKVIFNFNFERGNFFYGKFISIILGSVIGTIIGNVLIVWMV